MAGMSMGMRTRGGMGYPGAGFPGQTMVPPAPDSLTNQYKLYEGGVEQNAQDYGDIMQGYKDLHAQAMGPNADRMATMKNLSTLSQTGGYSDADKQDIRARGMSPIRSIYANANRDIDRQKGIQGGYTPNYGAMKAKMARELSFSLGDQMNNINAGIADKVAGNKVGLAGTYASASNQGNQPAAQALQGMTSLYGTTPAMAATFGNQAANAAQLQNTATTQGNQQGLQAVANMRRRG